MLKRVESLPVQASSWGVSATPETVQRQMLALRRMNGSVLVAAAGKVGIGAHLGPKCVQVEIDAYRANEGALVQDFFAYDPTAQFDTVFLDAPFVPYEEISPSTLNLLKQRTWHRKANLFLFFIDKCMNHVKPGGELIVYSSRNFVRLSQASDINARLAAKGTITHFFDLADQDMGLGEWHSAIWRFEAGDFSCSTQTLHGPRSFSCSNGSLCFSDGAAGTVRLGDLVSVKLGAISGADGIYASEEHGNVEFVCSSTRRDGQTRKMVWSPLGPNEYLQSHKDRLLARKVARFHEGNWWQWGRADFQSDQARIYVNERTREREPFFVHSCQRYDGTVLGLFPKSQSVDVNLLAQALNEVDWGALGLCCDGRFVFNKRSLEEALLPDRFSIFKE